MPNVLTCQNADGDHKQTLSLLQCGLCLRVVLTFGQSGTLLRLAFCAKNPWDLLTITTRCMGLKHTQLSQHCRGGRVHPERQLCKEGEIFNRGTPEEAVREHHCSERQGLEAFVTTTEIQE